MPGLGLVGRFLFVYSGFARNIGDSTDEFGVSMSII
jgi:hypothetical protein